MSTNKRWIALSLFALVASGFASSMATLHAQAEVSEPTEERFVWRMYKPKDASDEWVIVVRP